jgi:hypothetical protein
MTYETTHQTERIKQSSMASFSGPGSIMQSSLTPFPPTFSPKFFGGWICWGIFILGTLVVLDAHAADYKLALSEEKDVCQLMLKFSNERFSNKGLSTFMQLENLPDLEAPEFELVGWVTERVNSSLSSVPASSTVVDINNDGQLDWVVKTQWALSSQYSDQLDIYVNHREALNFDEGLDSKDLDRADQHLSLTGRDYPLKKISPHKFKDGATRDYWIGGVFKLVLFRFRNVTYILMATPGALPELSPGTRKFAVVVKYVPTFELQDVCYIEEIRGRVKKP